MAGLEAAGKGEGLLCVLLAASLAMTGEVRTISATGLCETWLVAELSFELGPEPQPLLANGEIEGAAVGAAGDDVAGARDALAAGAEASRGALCEADRAPEPEPAPLSNSSIGRSLCA